MLERLSRTRSTRVRLRNRPHASVALNQVPQSPAREDPCRIGLQTTIRGGSLFAQLGTSGTYRRDMKLPGGACEGRM
jgi:hypothetical protein